MEFILVIAGTAILMTIGQVLLARWGSGYTRRWGDQHWKDINGTDVPEDTHYR